jgi:hypothetical protein
MHSMGFMISLEVIIVFSAATEYKELMGFYPFLRLWLYNFHVGKRPSNQWQPSLRLYTQKKKNAAYCVTCCL